MRKQVQFVLALLGLFLENKRNKELEPIKFIVNLRLRSRIRITVAQKFSPGYKTTLTQLGGANFLFASAEFLFIMKSLNNTTCTCKHDFAHEKFRGSFFHCCFTRIF